MVISGTWNHLPVTISAKVNCLTISLELPEKTEVFSFDYAGRMWTALLDRVSYRRGLDGKIVAKWQSPEKERRRRWLPANEARQVEARARQRVLELYQAIRTHTATLSAPLSQQAKTGFERAIAFDDRHSQVDIERYQQVYKPVGILPPDQYMAVVLQATEGCAFNTCSFCTFYRDRPFRIKKPDEFRMHARAVRDFIGEGLSLRRTIFLGDANALVAPMVHLEPLLDVVHQEYDVEKLGGLYAFLDGFSAEKKTVKDYRRLAAYGLKRVYIGLESGNASLLKFLKKPGRPSDAIEAVHSIKAGGVSVGVIVLLGAGGHAYAARHVHDTIRALNAMTLDQEDLLYFSELIVSEGMDYMRDAFQAGLQPLTPEERIEQGEAIEASLIFNEGMPHISRYDIREFVY